VTRSIVSSAIAATAAVAAMAGSAHADLTAEQQQVESELRDMFYAIQMAHQYGSEAESYFHRKAEDCVGLIEKGTKLGIKPGQVMSGSPDSYLFKRAADKCEDYRKWRLTIKAAVILDRQSTIKTAMSTMQPGEAAPELALSAGAEAKQCIAEVDGAIAQGAITDQKVSFRGEPLTLIEAKRAYCQWLVDWAAGYAVETAKVIDAEAAAVKEKYTKHGITGDRLRLFIAEDGSSWYGKGCDSSIRDMAKLKKASLLFTWTETVSGDKMWTVWRYQFKGDKLVSQKSRSFSKIEAAYGWCK
jgi:hypothetical protein